MNSSSPHRPQKDRFRKGSSGLIVLALLTVALTLAFAIAPDLSALAFQSNSPLGSPSPFPTFTPVPTETPLSTTPTPIPPTPTLIPPTDTPIIPIDTPVGATATPEFPLETPFPTVVVPPPAEIVIPPTLDPDIPPPVASPTAILVIPPTETPTIGVSTPAPEAGQPVTMPITVGIDGPIIVLAPGAQPPETNPEALVSLIDTFVLYSAWFLLGCGVIAFGGVVVGVIFVNRRARTMIEETDDLTDEEDVF